MSVDKNGQGDKDPKVEGAITDQDVKLDVNENGKEEKQDAVPSSDSKQVTGLNFPTRYC